MKRVLALLSLVCVLFLASACHYDVSLSVEATADLLYYSDPVRITSQETYCVHQKTLSDTDLEWIFLSLLKANHVNDDFRAAYLYLSIYDEIGGKFLREETYGVVYDSFSGHYEFTEM